MAEKKAEKKPSDSDRIDAILEILRENGFSLDHKKALK